MFFSALTLLLGRPEEHPACKNWVMRCWCGYLSGARCRLFAYGPANATAVSKVHHLCLPYLNPDILPFWYWLTQVVLERSSYRHVVIIQTVKRTAGASQWLTIYGDVELRLSLACVSCALAGSCRLYCTACRRLFAISCPLFSVVFDISHTDQLSWTRRQATCMSVHIGAALAVG